MIIESDAGGWPFKNAKKGFLHEGPQIWIDLNLNCHIRHKYCKSNFSLHQIGEVTYTHI